MDNMLIYLLKVSAGTAMFYLCYLLFFRKETFYLRNRVFLILTLLLPAIIPVIRYKIVSQSTAMVNPTALAENFSLPANTAGSSIINTISTNTIDYNKIIITIYFVIAAILILRAVISLLSTFRNYKES